MMHEKLLSEPKRTAKERCSSSVITVRVLNANRRRIIVKVSSMLLENGSAKTF